MEIDDNEKMRSSPRLAVQRELPKEELIDSIDLVEPFNAPTNITVAQKMPRWEQQMMQDAEGHEAPYGTFQ